MMRVWRAFSRICPGGCHGWLHRNELEGPAIDICRAVAGAIGSSNRRSSGVPQIQHVPFMMLKACHSSITVESYSERHSLGDRANLAFEGETRGCTTLALIILATEDTLATFRPALGVALHGRAGDRQTSDFI